MNRVMWANAAVQSNKDTLAERGVRILGPGSGEQACGEVGEGRMLNPDEIAAIICGPSLVNTEDLLLTGKTVVITAGPTREPLDPVRFISNRSSGKMGYAMAAAALEQGARVVLISGPTALAVPAAADVRHVETAAEMFAATHEHIAAADIFIGAAAVSDYRPVAQQAQKIKKDAATMTIELVRNEDILASVAALQKAPFTVGFAAETENLREYALGKLEAKKLGMIIANQVGKGLGFDSDQNAVTVYWKAGEQSFDLADKQELARDLVQLIAERYEIAYSSGAYAIN
jgi:phosphopantothenoylcysteine decarboxylase/phosphopantothenate--cysteine ligase